MPLSARSWATMLLLALTFSLGSAAAAGAQAAPGGCGTPATPAVPANPTPGVPGATPATPAIPANPVRCTPGPDGILGTADDGFVLGGSFGPDGFPLRADTGAGGTAGSGIPALALLLGGGLLALAAAFGVRRATHAPQA